MANRQEIEKRIIKTASEVLQQQQYIRPIDILLGLGWLCPNVMRDWRKGKIPYLEQGLQANLTKLSFAMQFFRKWALQNGLKPSKTVYLTQSIGSKNQLRFSKSGDLDI